MEEPALANLTHPLNPTYPLDILLFFSEFCIF